VVSKNVFLFLCYLLHIVDSAQRIFRRANMKLLSGSVNGPCNKPIKYPYYSIRVQKPRSQAVQACPLNLFCPSSCNTVSLQRVVTLMEVTVRRSQDTVLLGVGPCNCTASRPGTPLWWEPLCGNFNTCMLPYFSGQLLKRSCAGLRSFITMFTRIHSRTMN
jgi:hypothetical protein